MSNRADTFNRTDTTNAIGTPSDAGSAWVQGRGTWGISGNNAYESGGIDDSVCVLETSEADGEFELTMSAEGSSNFGVVIRYTDADNFIYLEAFVGDAIWLRKREAGSNGDIGTFGAATITDTSVVKLVFSGTTIDCYVGGALIFSRTSSFNQTATKHGIWHTGFGAARFDGITFTGSAPATSLSITTPVAAQVIQSAGAIGSAATVLIEGTTTGGSPDEIEYNADWIDGSYHTLDASPSGGTFSGSVSLAAGQGTLTCRVANDLTASDTVANVGVGEIIAVAGQSNAEWPGDNAQTYLSHDGFTLSRFDAGGSWAAYSDAGEAGGSAWPAFASHLSARYRVPVGILTCAVGGSSINDWQPADTNYTALIDTIDDAGGCRAIFFWQGETDIENEMDQATYNGLLDTTADEVATDAPGTLFLPAKLQTMSDYPDADEAEVNDAIEQAWGDSANVTEGPDLTQIQVALHLEDDEDLQTAGFLWWMAFYAAMNPAGGGSGVGGLINGGLISAR